jgi:lysophospholipase L1-like esterase
MRTLLSLILCLLIGKIATAADDRTPVRPKMRIILVGDSTVTEHAGWGLGFRQFLSGDAECLNTAVGGRSSRSFIAEGHWAKALALKGDYYLIQFGHNDQPGKGPERETDPATTYPEFMARYVDEARAIGAVPVLITSLTRRDFDPASNRIVSSLEPYAAAVRKLAAEKNVALIDLHERSVTLCNELGPERAHRFDPPSKNDKPDHTHLNAEGSLAFARLVVIELRHVVPALDPFLPTEPAPLAPAAAP